MGFKTCTRALTAFSLSPGERGYWIPRVISLLCFFVGLVAAVVTALAYRGRSKRTARLVRICEIVAYATIALGLILLVLGVALGWAAASAPGLPDADRAAMWRSAASSIAKNLAVFVLAAAPPLLVARWVRRRQSSD